MKSTDVIYCSLQQRIAACEAGLKVPSLTRCKGSARAVLGDVKRVVEFEPDTDMRDTEQVSLLEEGGSTLQPRETLPIRARVGYEITFLPLLQAADVACREESRAYITAPEKETEGLLYEVIRGGRP